MVEYGIRTTITDNHGGIIRILRIFFTDMSYYDWMRYSSPDKMYDYAHIRGLFNKYITRIVNETEDIEYNIDDLMKEDDPVKENVILQILEKSGFNDNELIMKTVSEYRDKGLTLAGSYDTFIFLNTSPEFYYSYLHQDMHNRSHIISMLERLKKFTVESRYRDAVSENIEINLVHEPREYDVWKQNIKRGQALNQQSRERRANKVSQNKNVVKTPIDERLSEIINQSQIALSEAIQQSQRNPSTTFDFENDEKDFGDY